MLEQQERNDFNIPSSILDQQNIRRFENSLLNGIYLVLNKIGSKQYCTLYEGLSLQSKKQVSIILINTKSIQNQQSFQIKQLAKRKNQAQINLMQRCNSAYIPKLLDNLIDFSYIINVTQHYKGKNLTELVLINKYNQIQSILILKQIISGLYQLNKYTYPHTSLNPQNIIWSQGIFKIAEFGYNKLINPKTSNVFNDNNQWNQLAAIEIQKDQPYNLKAQVWNIGIIFYYLLFHKLPFSGFYNTENSLIIPLNSISKNAKQFLNKTIVRQSQRINWNQMIKDPIFSNLNIQQSRYLLVDTQINNLVYQIQFQQELHDKKLQRKQFIHSIKQPYFISEKKLLQIEFITNLQLIKDNKQLLKKRIQEIYYFENKFLDIQKTKWIFNSIYRPIISERLLSESRQTIQFQYLLMCRCKYNLSTLKLKLQQKRQISQNYRLKCNFLLDLIHKLKNTIYQAWADEQNKLLYQQSRWFKNLFYIFPTDQRLVHRQNFLRGIESLDYEKNQQIQYTYNYFKIIIENKLIKNSIKIWKMLNSYKQINQYTFEDLQRQNYIKFSEYLQNIIK